MTGISRHFRLLAVVTALAATPLAAASAQPVDDALDRLKALMADFGVTLDWEDVDASGGDAVLTGVSFSTEHGEPIEVGEIVLEGISRVDTGYRVESLSLDSYQAGDLVDSFLVEGVELTGVILPDEDQRATYGGFVFYETMSTDLISFSRSGRPAVVLSGLYGEYTSPEDSGPMGITGEVESFTIESFIMEDDQRVVLEALGYEQLRGHIELTGSWDPAEGRLTLSQYDIAVIDAGTLSMSLELGGYTRDFVASMVELQQQMADNPDEENSAAGLAALGLLQQLSFTSAEISFSDDSLTGKVLEMLAEQQGMRRSDVANQARAVMPFVLGQLGNQELTMTATQAVSSFLDDPQVLRITAAPPQPVPFALIMAGAMGAPGQLVQTLGVRVTAND